MPDEGVDAEKRTTLRRFAALGAAGPLARFQSADDSESDVPGAIAGYVAATPGAHFSKLRDDLKLGTGEAQHHLRQLEREGVIESRKDGDYRRYFPTDRFSEFEQVALGYLRRETPRGMLVALLRDPDRSAGDLADRLDVSTPTISKYASQLEAADMLARGDGYTVRNPETVMLLLVRHADSFGADATALAAEADAFIRYNP